MSACMQEASGLLRVQWSGVFSSMSTAVKSLSAMGKE